MRNTLNKIIADKKKSVESYKKSLPLDKIKKNISEYNNYIAFKDKLTKNKINVIAEVKKASPSAGIIVENYNPKEIARKYLKSGASCLSVLTEENYFKGKLEHIEEVKKEVKLPILCKDFFVDPYQVYLAKSFGADAILIILAAIDEKTSKDIFSVAEELNISTIIEVHTKEEAKKALFNAELIIIAPSNPLVSIKPILEIPGFKSIIQKNNKKVIAISPLIQGKAVKGPASKMLKQLGFKPNSFSCMQFYKDICKSFILDRSDKGLEKQFVLQNQKPIFTNTLMTSLAEKRRLAKFIINQPID